MEAELHSPTETHCIVGVIISRTVRSRFCTLVLMLLATDSGHSAAASPSTTTYYQRKALRIQFDDEVKPLRSHCRRTCKLGDQIRVGMLANAAASSATAAGDSTTEHSDEDHDSLLCIHVDSIVAFGQRVRVLQRQVWTILQCQEQQQRFYDIRPPNNSKAAGRASQHRSNPSNDDKNRVVGTLMAEATTLGS